MKTGSSNIEKPAPKKRAPRKTPEGLLVASETASEKAEFSAPITLKKTTERKERKARKDALEDEQLIPVDDIENHENLSNLDERTPEGIAFEEEPFENPSNDFDEIDFHDIIGTKGKSFDEIGKVLHQLEKQKAITLVEESDKENTEEDPNEYRTAKELEIERLKEEIEDLNKFDIFDLPESHDSRFDDQHLDKSMKATSPKKNEAYSNFSRYLGQNHPEIAERSPKNMSSSELEERKAFNSFKEKMRMLPPPSIMDADPSDDNLVMDGIAWFTEQEKPFWSKFRNEISSEIEFRKKYYPGSDLRQETLADIESKIRHLAYYPEKKSKGHSGNNAWHFLKEKFLNFKKNRIDRNKINSFLDAQSEHPDETADE